MPKISQLPIGTAPTGSETLAAVQGGSTVLLTALQLSTIGANAVSIVDYGAVASDATKYIVNQTAIHAALATGKPVYFPEGSTFYTQAITIPTNAHSLFGRATLIAAGTISAQGLLLSTSSTNLAIRDLTIQINTTTYTTLDAIDLTSCTDPLVEGVTVNGYNGILATSCTRPTINRCRVSDFNNIGIVTRASNDVKIVNNSVTTTNTTTSYYGIQVSEGVGVGIHNNEVSSAYSFGIVVSGVDGSLLVPSSRISITGNRTLNVGLEGINITNGQHFTIVGNVVEWTNGSSRDFGISVFGDPNTSSTVKFGTIAGNAIHQPGKAGIALANNVENVIVSGNTIYDANKLIGVTAYHISGILVYGRGASHNHVIGNNIVDPSSHLTWAANEYDDGVGVGAPDYNSFACNTGVGSSGQTNIIGTHSSIGSPEFYLAGAHSTPGTGSVTLFDPAMAISDSHFALFDDADSTKQIRLQLSGIATGQTRTWTVPDASDTFAGLAATQTLTNKTLTAPNIGDAIGSSVTLSSSTPFTATGVNANFELGSKGTANTPFIDFNSSGNTNDFDSRLIASGGGVTSGLGTLTWACSVMISQGSLVSSNPTAGVGYATGAGGTVTQATSKATAVALNKVTGLITLNAAALAAATIVTFVFTNSAIAATDQVVVTHESGGTLGAYGLNGRATGAGTGAVDVRNNTAGSLSEAIVLRFYINKSVNA